MLWHIDRAAEVLRWYREFIVEAPEEMNGFFLFLTVPPGEHFPEELHLQKMCAVMWCYAGPQDQADSIFEPIRHVAGGPALDLVAPIPYPAFQSMFDAMYPPGLQMYWRSDFFEELVDGAIERHVEFGNALPTPLSAMHLYPVNGRAARVPREATAFSYRDAIWNQVMVGIDPDPRNAALVRDWAVRYWEALHPYSAGGAYVNMMMDDEGVDRVHSAYRDNYSRLAAIKARYDPGNLFRVNQNIPPLLGAAHADEQGKR
jgi:FAD/FMN-containing dehydrogenase